MKILTVLSVICDILHKNLLLVSFNSALKVEITCNEDNLK